MEKECILVIEDEIEILNNIKFILESKGYSVITAKDGREALNKILKTQAEQIELNLIVTDIHMPGLSGLGVIENIKALDIDVPILIVSGFVTKELKESLIRKGCEDWLEKPFSRQQLTEAVKRMLKLKQSINEV